MLKVTVADKQTGKVMQSVTATRNHMEGKGWVPAGALAIGNAIITRAGPSLIVKDIQWLRRPEGFQVYNFEVEDDHSYFVGTAHGGLWVHNAKGDCGLTLPFDDGPSDLNARAQELHGLLDPIAQKQRATAVLQAENDGKPFIIVGSSEEGIFPAAQRRGLRPGEIPARNPGNGAHAEDATTMTADNLGLTPTHMGVAGQPICPRCQERLTGRGIRY